jgi:hypothetical protein
MAKLRGTNLLVLNPVNLHHEKLDLLDFCSPER